MNNLIDRFLLRRRARQIRRRAVFAVSYRPCPAEDYVWADPDYPMGCDLPFDHPGEHHDPVAGYWTERERGDHE